MALTISLEGKTALVTGGNGGLGMAMARGLMQARANIAVIGRDEDKNRRAEAELGAEALVLQADVSSESAVTSAVQEVADRFDGIDILVNCAGGFSGGSLTEMTLEGWNLVLGSHLTGSFLVSKHAARAMVGSGRGGKIINVGSMYSLYGAPDFCDYAAAKAGILGLTRSLAVELGRHNIQVNAILPGWYETDLTRGLPDEPLGQEIRRRTPMGRWGQPGDLLGVTVFLASPWADFITGALIPVDGGYSVSDRLLFDEA
jgi:2-deoxy-D-gluconate 3-dehydrogenase